ncbi:MAG: hypothetical protein SF029_16210 [bacterium]|nr:hypothetical protein [bacterium]
MSNRDLDYVLEELIKFRDRLKNTSLKDYIGYLVYRLERGITISEREWEDALMGALRNSEFPGDYVGRPDDDFEDDEE